MLEKHDRSQRLSRTHLSTGNSLPTLKQVGGDATLVFVCYVAESLEYLQGSVVSSERILAQEVVESESIAMSLFDRPALGGGIPSGTRHHLHFVLDEVVEGEVEKDVILAIVESFDGSSVELTLSVICTEVARQIISR